MIKLFESSVEDEFFFAENIDSRGFQKTASVRDLPEEADRAIKDLVRKPNHKYVLVSAMGDGETWGSNRNADYFPNRALTGKQGMHEKINKEKGAQLRYKTFEDAHFFHHHRNKIERGDPHFGYVAKSLWNPKMRTVLLIVGVDAKRDPQTAQEIEDGTVHAFSMGAKLPWDECSICGNKAKKRSDYCTHLSTMPNKVLDDGRRVFSYNHEPSFFDISKVTKPAFEGGRTLMKVAHTLGSSILSVDLADEYGVTDNDFNLMASKSQQSAFEKIAQIQNNYSPHLVEMCEKIASAEVQLPSALLAKMSETKDFGTIWGAFAQAGIIPSMSEFAYIVMMKAGRSDLAAQYIGKDVIAKGVMDWDDIDPKDLHMVNVHMNGESKRLSQEFNEIVRRNRSIDSLVDRAYAVTKDPQEKNNLPEAELGPLLACLYFKLREKIGDQVCSMHKTAGAGTAALVGGALVAPYIYSSYAQNQMMNGQNVGIVGRTLANNPGKLAIGGALTAFAPQAMGKTVRELYHAVRGRKG